MGKTKITLEEIGQFLKDNGDGDVLLESEYFSYNTVSLNVLCHRCGKIYKTCWQRIKIGNRCRDCSYDTGRDSVRNSNDEVMKIIEESGLTLLEDFEYKNQNTKIHVEDFAGYRYLVSLSGIMRSLNYKNGEINLHKFHKGNHYSLHNISVFLYLNKYTTKLIGGKYINEKSNTLTFLCKEGHEFKSSLAKMRASSSRNGCTVCSGREVKLETSFGYNFPDLSKEWSSKNNISPFEITWGKSKEKFYWICSNGHNDYLCSPANRRAGKGCPSCSNKTTEEHNLKIEFPEILKDWNYVANGNPENYAPYGNEKVKWICHICGYNWEAFICNRTKKKGTGCPNCEIRYFGETKILNWLNNNREEISSVGVTSFNPQKRFLDCKDKKALPFDFGLLFDNKSWLLIEYHGKQHYEPVEYFGGIEKFKDQKRKDKIKEKYCKKNNIPLLIIPYWEFDNIEKILEKNLFYE